MPTYFASDVHLRLDHPDRGVRFGRWIDTLRPEDALYLVGDLCDFWFAARQRRADPRSCDGLRALADFSARGGTATVLLGNHDGWLGPFYERVFGAVLAPEPLEVVAGGLRLHLVHGHKVGARPPWKGIMESRAFLAAFARAPGPAARLLNVRLDFVNELHRAETTLRHLRRYWGYANALSPAPDLAVFGHVHALVDDDSRTPRMVVLGSWHCGGSYLRVDDGGARLVVVPPDESEA